MEPWWALAWQALANKRWAGGLVANHKAIRNFIRVGDLSAACIVSRTNPGSTYPPIHIQTSTKPSPTHLHQSSTKVPKPKHHHHPNQNPPPYPPSPPRNQFLPCHSTLLYPSLGWNDADTYQHKRANVRYKDHQDGQLTRPCQECLISVGVFVA